jgi:iron complex transport system permease protein
MFRNPLVGPKIIGVSSGASLGGVLALLLMLPDYFVPILASVFGIMAILCTLFIAKSGSKTNILSLVLGGIVTGRFFTALVSLVKYSADPDDILPTIVYWLLGSFNDSSYLDVAYVALPLLVAGSVVYRMRHTINILSLGEEEAQSLGIDVVKSRMVLLLMTAILVASAVSVSGVIGWVGLIIPHFARMICGPNHVSLIPVSALTGAIYMVFVDTVARTASYGEIPIGVLTALVGAPVFAWLLRKNQAKGWNRD